MRPVLHVFYSAIKSHLLLLFAWRSIWGSGPFLAPKHRFAVFHGRRRCGQWPKHEIIMRVAPVAAAQSSKLSPNIVRGQMGEKTLAKQNVNDVRTETVVKQRRVAVKAPIHDATLNIFQAWEVHTVAVGQCTYTAQQCVCFHEHNTCFFWNGMNCQPTERMSMIKIHCSDMLTITIRSPNDPVAYILHAVMVWMALNPAQLMEM